MSFLQKQKGLGDELAQKPLPGGGGSVAPYEERPAHAGRRGRDDQPVCILAVRVRPCLAHEDCRPDDDGRGLPPLLSPKTTTGDDAAGEGAHSPRLV